MNPHKNENISFPTATITDELKPMQSTPPIDVLYLAGVSFCGSTLLSFILNAHPKIFSIGEMGPYAPFENDEYQCSCGAKLMDCSFFLAVKNLMENKYNVPFDTAHWDLRHEHNLGRFINLMTRGWVDNRFLALFSSFLKPIFSNYNKVMETYAHRNEVFMRAALDITGKQVFFDATKSFRRIQLFRNKPHLNFKVLHLVRDPRGYVYSAIDHRNTLPQISAKQWVMENNFIDANLRGLDSHQWMRLKYETLCLEPEKTINNLADFAGVNSLSALTKHFGEKEHHIIGNSMRLRPDALKSIKLNEKWRNSLSTDDLRIVSRIAGEHAQKYGYDI
jgi:Sulfotransferase domain